MSIYDFEGVIFFVKFRKSSDGFYRLDCTALTHGMVMDMNHHSVG